MVATITRMSTTNAQKPDGQAPKASRAGPDVLVRLGAMAAGEAGRAALRAQAIEQYLPMATRLARRYTGRGEPLADLIQVAAIGLVKAVDRFDPTRGVAFTSFAIPTIVGEIKRYFRDYVWHVRLPREMQEFGPRLTRATEELTHLRHRSPTTAELAAQLGVSQDDIVAARRYASAYRPLSFQQPGSTGGDGLRVVDGLSGSDHTIETVERRAVLRRGLAELPERQRRVIALRYFADLTQTEIAAELGVSQMQISRLLAQALTGMHDAISVDTTRVPVGSVPPRRRDPHARSLAAGPAAASRRGRSEMLN
jgi:RNA polymerase sigma-B factor